MKTRLKRFNINETYNVQDIMSVPTTIGDDYLKDRIYDFLYKNGSIWEDNYGDYLIEIGDESEMGWTVGEPNPNYHKKRENENEGWKRSAYIRNGYIIKAHHMGVMKDLIEHLGITKSGYNKSEIDDIDLHAKINDYIVDWFIEHKEEYIMNKNN